MSEVGKTDSDLLFEETEFKVANAIRLGAGPTKLDSSNSRQGPSNCVPAQLEDDDIPRFSDVGKTESEILFKQTERLVAAEEDIKDTELEVSQEHAAQAVG
jgi:hypothetical protein